MNIELPKPTQKCTKDYFQLIHERRSRRHFLDSAISIQELSDILTYTCGLTGEFLFNRAAPSAGGLHAITVFILVSNVTGLKEGLYKYDFKCHRLEPVFEGNRNEALFAACLKQGFVAAAPLSLIFAVEEEVIEKRYHSRAKRYAALDCGHYGQNVYMICEVLGLATCGVGAYDDARVSSVLQLDAKYSPYYIFPIGRRTK